MFSQMNVVANLMVTEHSCNSTEKEINLISQGLVCLQTKLPLRFQSVSEGDSLRISVCGPVCHFLVIRIFLLAVPGRCFCCGLLYLPLYVFACMSW